MEPEDPDLSFADLGMSKTLSEQSARYHDTADQLKAAIAGMAAQASGATPTKNLDQMRKEQAEAQRLGDSIGIAAKATAAIEKAAKAWRDGVGTGHYDKTWLTWLRAQLDSKRTAMADAETELQNAQSSEDSDRITKARTAVSNATSDFIAAQREYDDAKAARQTADETLDAAVAEATEQFNGGVAALGGASYRDMSSDGNFSNTPNNPGTTSSRPAGSPASSPGNAAPGSAKAAGAAAPGGSPSPDTRSSSSGGVDPVAVLNALRQQPAAGQQQQPAGTGQQPAATAQPVSSTQPGKNDKSDAITNSDLDNAFGTPPGLAALATTPTPTPRVSVPSPASGPAAGPAEVSGGPTGNSVQGMKTETNVTGRPEGATAQTRLSAAESGNAMGKQGTPAATAPHGAGGVPIMPGMGGVGQGGGSTKQADPVRVRQVGPDVAEVWGEQTIAESVRGGTIAKKDPLDPGNVP
ncbi:MULTISPECIES: hypothetical protein [Mycobacteriaceae]|jgi:hypothetical protein|uniref:Uncharacterized protein n=3 Tax=Mycobacteriaceae TaxID=1762 RepID=A0ABR5FMG6_9MYCO|nr:MULTISPECIES: hypothetical protein [Mycobacteriaceae]KLI09335.1 hypothetical protein AA982_04635 [Mycolicibacterium senegalense]KLO47727.1 hypothetical protein ABW05_31655 [Mycolicibacterium senegalense]OHT92457.1 hypothetical protein BKG61_24200 [Mycobacterium syngnathidarum]OLT97728.1 hypothetical protein BKG60_05010 [Mycobacterium syngnathidarum]OMB84104.1 hypothetical protein A5741_21010 [Mycolicibacterium conceptionense]